MKITIVDDRKPFCSTTDIINLSENHKITGYTFFWGHTNTTDKINKSCFSQWYYAPFIYEDGNEYKTAEQFMMAQKALLFNDEEIFNKILNETDPKKCKSLGRLIKNFSEEEWNKYKYGIVFAGNFAKFTSNNDLKDFLLSTGEDILAEASPYDGIWGIKKSQNDKDIENPRTWQGENLLGIALMEVRKIIRIHEDLVNVGEQKTSYKNK